MEEVINTIGKVAETIGETTTAIAKLKEIKRTTGISNRQRKKLLNESTTNLELANNFLKLCQKNPGILFTQKIGNFYMSNISATLDYANNKINPDELVPNTTLDDEWIVKFLDIAGQTTNQEKQKILADVLIGKIKKPDTISYRTLRILGDLTKKEIELFYKALSVAFYSENNYAFIPRDINNNFEKISLSEILILDECNLIDSSPSIGLNIKKEINVISCDKSHVLIINPKKPIKLNCNYFSESALELIPFISFNTNFSNSIIESAKKFNCDDVDISLFKITKIENDSIYYDKTNLI